MNETQEKAIKHYDEMIEWAERQNQEEHPTPHKMVEGIHQTWGACNCSYCINYFYACSECDLGISGNCCDGLWKSMNDSWSWKMWVKYAKEVRLYIIKNG